MKKLIAILALLALTGNIASAELLKNFKYDGIIDVNAYSSKNNSDANDDADDTTSQVDTRLQVNMAFDLNDDVDAVVSAVKNDRQYGEGSQNGTGATGVLDLVKFEQAYLNLKGVFGLDHKLGRQYYGEEGDLVVYLGPTNWPYQPALPVSALDAWTGWYTNDKWNIHAVAGKITESAAGNPDLDQDLTGIVAKYMLNDNMSLGAYYYTDKTYSAVSDTVLKVAGAKVMGKLAGFNYYGEYAKNMGQNGNTAKYEGSALLAKADYGMDIAGKLTFMGEFAMGSGDDNSTDTKTEQFVDINSDYRPGIFWGGFNGMNGLTDTGLAAVNVTGLTTWNIGAKWMPDFQEKLSLSAKYIFLAPTEDKLDGASIGYDEMGTELDLCATWQHSENVKIKAYYAYFMPEKNYVVANGLTTDDPAHVVGALFNVKF
ncbi:MAG TPA: hypothetical protein DDW67_05570 [Elusimicrobia bacterium]|jgi:hypothetical protein|nr:hypothetical protein [Elusimicrobiota bacterium]